MSRRSPLKSNVQAAREALGLSRKEFGLSVGLKYTTIYELETGGTPRIPDRVIAALQSYGFDTSTAQADFATWRVRRGIEIREAIREMLAARRAAEEVEAK